MKCKIKVIVMGRGPLQNYVESMSNKESNLIEYLGLINYNDMPTYYSASDVHVIPVPSGIVWESGPATKLFEGMAMKKIVLGSDVGGMTDVITNKKNGVIFHKEDKNDLLKKIDYIIDNIQNMDDIRTQARKDIIEKHSWEKSRELLQQDYETIGTKSS